MSDIGDDFKALKEYKKEQQRIYNEKNLPDQLNILNRLEKYISYEIKNNGTHYILNITDLNSVKTTVDLWPTTGKWIVRNKKQTSGRGIINLLKYFKLPLENSTHFILS